MEVMQSRNRTQDQPEEDEWLQYKDLIQELYIVRGMALKEVRAELESRGFTVTSVRLRCPKLEYSAANVRISKSQLEYKVATKWNFQKNLPQPIWIYIDRTIAKRKLDGKGSEVFHRGKRLKQSTINKNTKRYRTRNDEGVAIHTSEAALDMLVEIRTPPASCPGTSWPPTLPWLKFSFGGIQHMLESVSTNGQVGDHATLVESVRHLIVSTSDLIAPQQDSLAEDQSSETRLVALLENCLPDLFPEEYEQRARTLRNGSSKEKLIACFGFLIYQTSNNLTDCYRTTLRDRCRYVTVVWEILKCSGIVNVRKDWWNLGYRTIQGFMSTLFQTAVDCFLLSRYKRHSPNLMKCDDYLALLSWLCSSGFDVNSELWLDCYHSDTCTVLQAATYAGHLHLIQACLDLDANPNAACGGSPPLLVLLENGISDLDYTESCLLHTVGALLSHGAIVDWAFAFRMAVNKEAFNVADVFLKKGADPGARGRVSTQCPHEETALIVAARSGIVATKYVLAALMRHYPLHPQSTFVTAEVLIAAGKEGRSKTFKQLYNLNPRAAGPDGAGITALHSAVKAGSLSACRLLLNFGGYPPFNPLIPSPIHVACSLGYYEIVKLFADAQVDINSTATFYEISGALVEPLYYVQSCQQSVCDEGSAIQLTPLALLLAKQESFRKFRLGPCAVALLRAGSRVNGREAIAAALVEDELFLRMALNAGADANALSNDGHSVLQIVIASDVLRSTRTVKFLLEKGARLRGGEFRSAVDCSDWEVAALLYNFSNGIWENVSESVDSTCTESGSEASCEDVHKALLETDMPLENSILVSSSLNQNLAYTIVRLQCAVENVGLIDAVRQLLKHRPSDPPDEQVVMETTAIAIAAWLGNLDLLRILLDSIPLNQTAFLPIYNGERMWWSHPCSRRYGSPLVLAVQGRSEEAVGMLLRRGYEPDTLTWRNSRLPMIDLLMKSGKRIDDCKVKNGGNPLVPALGSLDGELFAALLRAGADVNEPEWIVEGFIRYTLLQLTVKKGQLDLIKAIVNAGANINAPADPKAGATALQVAAISGQVTVAKLLLDFGAHVNAPRALSEGRTALEGAAENGRLDMLELLLQSGALITGVGRIQFVRAVKFAIKRGRHPIVSLLREHGGWCEADESLISDADLLANSFCSIHHLGRHDDIGQGSCDGQH